MPKKTSMIKKSPKAHAKTPISTNKTSTGAKQTKKTTGTKTTKSKANSKSSATTVRAGKSKSLAPVPKKTNAKLAKKTTIKTKVSIETPESGQQRILLNIADVGCERRHQPFLIEYFPSPEQARAEYLAREKELETQWKHAAQALKSVRKEWENGLEGNHQTADLNVGFRTKLGQVVSPLQVVILIDVSIKYAESTLTGHKLFQFPKQVSYRHRNQTIQVPTKVRQVCVTSALGDITSMLGRRIFAASTSSRTATAASSATAIVGGDEITSTAIPNAFGTLGICLPINGGGKPRGITNSHVAVFPEHFTSPVSISAGGSSIGTVEKTQLDNAVDAASIAPSLSAVFGEGVKELFTSGSNYNFLVNEDMSHDRFRHMFQFQLVKKYGAASKDTIGEIRKTDTSTTVRIPNRGFIQFSHLIEVSREQNAFLCSGDSGSVLIHELQNGGSVTPLVIGLNCAASDDGTLAYAIPIGKVLSELKTGPTGGDTLLSLIPASKKIEL